MAACLRWSKRDIGHWVADALELPQHRPRFEEHGIDGATFLQLTDSDLQEHLVVAYALQRKKILANISLLADERVGLPDVKSAATSTEEQDSGGCGQRSPSTPPELALGVKSRKPWLLQLKEKLSDTEASVLKDKDAMRRWGTQWALTQRRFVHVTVNGSGADGWIGNIQCKGVGSCVPY